MTLRLVAIPLAILAVGATIAIFGVRRRNLSLILALSIVVAIVAFAFGLARS